MITSELKHTEATLQEELVHEFIKYLVYWVAGAKLIFIMMAIVVIILGNQMTQIFTVVALIISILSFYWRLFPMIIKMDKVILKDRFPHTTHVETVVGLQRKDTL